MTLWLAIEQIQLNSDDFLLKLGYELKAAKSTSLVSSSTKPSSSNFLDIYFLILK